nr:NlpC/P60 family protein [Pontixanthobacter sp. CEM42]
MTSTADAFASAAESLVGTRFRLYGRSREAGVDCVGLTAHALSKARQKPCSIPRYGLRNAGYGFVLDFAERNGLVCVSEPVLRGDILLTRPGPAQRHLLVALGPNRFVHAHAGLRSVTAMPGPLPWPLIHQFRILEKC